MSTRRRPTTQTRPDAKPAPPERPPRTKATYLLPTDVVERARNAAVALAGPPVRLTLAALVTSAITQEVDRLEEEHNRGKAFPHFGEPLVGGRPLKATSEASRGPLRPKRR